MKILLQVTALFTFVVGLVWFLQGLNLLPGSFMTGQIQWAINGGVAMLLGAGLLFFANHRKNPNG